MARSFDLQPTPRYSEPVTNDEGRMNQATTYKTKERDLWNRFSRRYTKIALPEFRPVGQHLIRLAQLRSGMWVLDVATGPGEPALTIAHRVGSRGFVMGTDFSPAMLRLAVTRAKDAKITHVQFHHMDAEHLTLPDRMFDRVFCRFGLMLMPDAEQALREMHRVLTPEGQVAIAVWGTQKKAKLLGIIQQVLKKHRAFTVAEGTPDFFRFGKAGALERALQRAGFHAIHTHRMTVEWVFATPQECWNSMKQGPTLRHALEKASPAVRKAIREDIIRHCTQFQHHNKGTIHLPNEAVLAVGTR